jgi:hypothetical protein
MERGRFKLSLLGLETQRTLAADLSNSLAFRPENIEAVDDF